LFWPFYLHRYASLVVVKKPTVNSDFTEYSHSVEDLALFVNLDGLEIEDVYWTSGPIIRDTLKGDFLPNWA